MPIDPSVLLKQTPLDIGGAVQEGANANLAVTRATAARTEFEDQKQDAAAIKDYSSLPGTDLYTTDGLKKAQEHLKGRISARSFMELGDRLTKAQTNELAYKTHALGLSKAVLEAEHDDNEFTVKSLAPYFNATAEEKPKALAAALESMASATKPDGTPRLTPKQIETLAKAPSSSLDAMYTTSDFKKAVNKNLIDEANIEDKKATAEMKRGMGPTEQWINPETDEVVLKGTKNGRVITADGKPVPGNAIPAGFVPMKDKRATAKPEEDGILSPEASTYIAEYQQVTGKQIPGIPAGSGAAARKARIAYMETFAQLGKERGYTGDEAGGIALMRDVSRESLKRLKTNAAIIEAGEKNLANVGNVITEELKKLGGPDSPLVRKYWNKASTEWAGDPQFSALNAALLDYKETAAKVYSGQTGAGGTPVTYLKAAEQSIGANPTLEQFSKTNEVMTKLFEARRKGTEDTIKELMQGSALVDKRTPEQKAATKVPAADQKARDGDTVQLMYQELKKTREQYKSAKPEDKDRLEKDIAGIQREIKKLGGKVEDAEPAGGTKVTTSSGRVIQVVP